MDNAQDTIAKLLDGIADRLNSKRVSIDKAVDDHMDDIIAKYGDMFAVVMKHTLKLRAVVRLNPEEEFNEGTACRRCYDIAGSAITVLVEATGVNSSDLIMEVERFHEAVYERASLQ